ncbi:MAG: 2-oxoglutarate ferredoxin oxidoreductase subunit alpha [Gemmatimonadetes bacterium]|nr:2-oxoglutarate ferredoxin oxidoreductase subunit alpha [Gemmatimonadota bacterium]
MTQTVQPLESVTIRFAGDSGDGMQLTGTQFTNASAIAGNDVATFPDYPAEIRAPAGTLAGVSGFQVNFGSVDIHTPGDELDALVAMNPAGLKANLDILKPNGVIVLNTAAFKAANVAKAGYTEDPRGDGSLDAFQVVEVDMNKLAAAAVSDMGLNSSVVGRTKNMLALGLMCWLYERPLEPTIDWITRKFASKGELAEANIRVLKAGHSYGETAEIFHSRFRVEPAKLSTGTYRSITGNQAVALGAVAASARSGRPLFLGSYPITPASDILHELAAHKRFGVVTFQAEDEIAGVCSSIGAAYGGSLAITTTSGPGMALKSEALGLAVKAELPLVIVNVQRGGPSTGLPTKTEQSDLFQAVLGRNGDTPIPVIAARSPSDCFDAMYEACGIALEYMMPVILLTDGYLANGAEPWLIPNFGELPQLATHVWKDADTFHQCKRDADTLARPWGLPGTPGMEHRIGGLETDIETGNVAYGGPNHQEMTDLRHERVARIARSYAPTEIDGPGRGGLLIVSWGSTYGSVRAAIESSRGDGIDVGHVHLRHLSPLPRDLGEILSGFDTVLVPEMNMGQLAFLLQATYPVRVKRLNRVEGRPFKRSEILAAIREHSGEER